MKNGESLDFLGNGHKALLEPNWCQEPDEHSCPYEHMEDKGESS